MNKVRLFNLFIYTGDYKNRQLLFWFFALIVRCHGGAYDFEPHNPAVRTPKVSGKVCG